MTKTYRARLIAVDGATQLVESPKPFTLTQLQGWVGGGYIERVRTRPPVREMYVNEDGISAQMPVNHAATALVHPDTLVLPPGIRGPVVVILRKGDPA